MEWENFFRDWTVHKTAKIQHDFIETILANTSRNDRLLELGAGSGLSSVILAFSDRQNVVASDINDSVLRDIRVTKPFLATERVDMFAIARPDHSVDCIFHQGLMEHFNDADIVRSLVEQARVARKVIFDVPNNKRFRKIREFGNERFLSVRRWIRLIRQANLRVVMVGGRRLPRMFDLLPHALHDSAFVKRIFGTSSIFVCERLDP